MKNLIKGIKRFEKKLVKKLSLQVILMTGISTIVVMVCFGLFLFFFSQSRYESFIETLSYLFSVRTIDKDINRYEDNRQYSVKITKGERDLWGDYHIHYELNKELVQMCSMNTCSVRPYLSTDASTTFSIIGQSILFSETMHKKGDLLIRKDIYDEYTSKGEKVRLKVLVRTFSSDGKILIEVFDNVDM